MTHEEHRMRRMFREEVADVDWRRPADRQRARLPLADDLWRLAAVERGARVADVGSGPGVFAERFAALGGAVTAVDLHAEALALVPRENDIKTVAHDVERAPLPPRFDVAFLVDVLHHAQDPRAMLRHLRQSALALVLAEYDPAGAGEVGPPIESRLAPADALAWLREEGWAPDDPVAARGEHYVLRAR